MDVKHKAWLYLHGGETDRGLALLRAWLDAAPENAGAWFTYAGALDFLDRAREALDAYETVCRLGIETLPPDDRPRLYAQLGSTLRNVGDLERSRTVLAEGLARYPHANALRVFLALTEIARADPRAAVDVLLDAVLAVDADESIGEYRHALRAYADAVRGRPMPERAPA